MIEDLKYKLLWRREGPQICELGESFLFVSVLITLLILLSKETPVGL